LDRLQVADLSGRDERERVARQLGTRGSRDAMDVVDRQKEGGGSPAAGHRECEDVAAGERGRDRVLLNGRRAGEAELVRGAEKDGVEAEACERHARGEV